MGVRVEHKDEWSATVLNNEQPLLGFHLVPGQYNVSWYAPLSAQGFIGILRKIGVPLDSPAGMTYMEGIRQGELGLVDPVPFRELIANMEGKEIVSIQIYNTIREYCMAWDSRKYGDMEDDLMDEIVPGVETEDPDVGYQSANVTAPDLRALLESFPDFPAEVYPVLERLIQDWDQKTPRKVPMLPMKHK